MAEQAKPKLDDHAMVHCLKCHTPQRNISVHLRRACMKNNTPEERRTERQKMKLSAHKWNCLDKTWDYKFLCRIVPHRASLRTVLEEFHKRGFVVKNVPSDFNRVWTYGVDDAVSPVETYNTPTPSVD